MTRFNLIQTEDPFPYAQQIFNFWDAYLPGTPHARLDWMCRGNPAGSATWLLALNEESGELMGTMSVMPKSYFAGSRILRVGIVGDFMVHQNNRVFGPAISLPKFVSEHCQELGFDFLYTIPNVESAKVLAHFGFRPVKILCSYVKPIKLVPYLRRYMPCLIARLLSPLFKTVAILMSLGLCGSSRGIFCEPFEFNEKFDHLFEEVKLSSKELIADHGSDYLVWRYSSNPLSGFRAITFMEPLNAKLSGYIVFKCVNDRLEIFDGFGLTAKDKRSLLKKITQIATREKCRAIQFILAGPEEWSRQLRLCGFFDSKDDTQVYCFGQYKEFSEHWYFLSGEKNI